MESKELKDRKKKEIKRYKGTRIIILLFVIILLPIILFFDYTSTIELPLQNSYDIAQILAITIALYVFIILTSLNDYFYDNFSLKNQLLKVGLILFIVFLFRIEVPLNYVQKMSQFNCDKNSKNIVKEVVKDNQITYYDYIRAAHAEGFCIDRKKELLEKKKKIDLLNKLLN